MERCTAKKTKATKSDKEAKKPKFEEAKDKEEEDEVVVVVKVAPISSGQGEEEEDDEVVAVEVAPASSSQTKMEFKTPSREGSNITPLRLNEKYDLESPYAAPKESIIAIHPRGKKTWQRAFVKLAKPIEISRSVDNRDKQTMTHICLICLELDAERYLLGGHTSNLKTHLAQHAHKEIVFLRIRELDGRSMKVYKKADPLISERSSINAYIAGTEKTSTPDSIMQECAARLCLARGWSLDALDGPIAKAFLESVRNMSSGMSLTLDRSKMIKNILRLYDKHWDDFRTLLLSEDAICFSMVIDGWDWGKKLKIIGATAVVLSRTPTGLRQDVFPVHLRLMNPDGSIDADQYVTIQTMSSGSDMANLVIKSLQSRNIPLDKFNGARSDGASNAVKCTNLINAYAKAGLALEKLLKKDVIEKACNGNFNEPNCFGHWFALAPKAAVSSRPGASEEDLSRSSSSIPEGPANEVVNLLKRVREIVSRLSESKMALRLAGVSKANDMGDVPAVHIDMEVRWISTYEMLKSFLRLEPLYVKLVSQCKAEHVTPPPTFTSSEFTSVAEICAILRPALCATSFMETSAFSVTPYVLPICAAILKEYGLDIKESGILESELDDHADPDFDDSSVSFTVERFSKPSSPPTENTIKFNLMTATAKSFANTLRQHLFHRLVKSRNNRNLVEMLAAYTDPVGHIMFERICGSTLRDLLAASMKSSIVKIAGDDASSSLKASEEEIDSSVKDADSSNLDEFDLTVETPRPANDIENEIKAFAIEAKTLMVKVLDSTRAKLNADEISRCAQVMNPLSFWNLTRISKFPRIFTAACAVVGFASHSALQESVFSSANSTLMTRMTQLSKNPGLLEAVVVLRYKYNTSSELRRSVGLDSFIETLEEPFPVEIEESIGSKSKSTSEEPSSKANADVKGLLMKQLPGVQQDIDTVASDIDLSSSSSSSSCSSGSEADNDGDDDMIIMY